MFKVKGEDTCSPFVGLFTTICARAGIIAVASTRQMQERLRISFIENSFTEIYLLPEVVRGCSPTPAGRRRKRVSLPPRQGSQTSFPRTLGKNDESLEFSWVALSLRRPGTSLAHCSAHL